ncbi:MAG TPA: class I SAM-dependent methyltransferase [Steroidobacter sp.]|uniref:class I SAM-dependent methyltransferase n=1 Tax=Steroidobacter sp. TaxID=1978227 RepID=UPI002EDA3A1A
MTETDLLSQESHFAFGKNWASYATLVTETQIDEAVAGLRRLVGGDLTGKRFLDIGCGSGLHSLAALRLGASEVLSLDIDPDSVATTQRMLEVHAPGKSWRVAQRSVFDMDPASMGQFDVVYSWGVLHHTGDMYRAVRTAASLVAPGGIFVFALYRYTRLCWFWKMEKRWYTKAGQGAQKFAQKIYVALFRLGKLVQGASFKDYVANYRSNRGMDFYHDVHDWMGGWPYESISPAQVARFMQQLQLREVRSFAYPRTPSGVFGSGCDEYVYTRA